MEFLDKTFAQKPSLHVHMIVISELTLLLLTIRSMFLHLLIGLLQVEAAFLYVNTFTFSVSLL